MATGQFNLNTSSSFRSSPKFSFPSRPESKDRKAGQPGPGAYKSVSTELDKYSNAPRWNMGAGVKDEGKMWAKLPGPGSYKPGKDPRFHDQPKWGFGSEPRLHEPKPQQSPGPGHYEVRGGPEGMQSTITGRPDSLKRSTTPGPGTYRQFSDQTNPFSPKFSFGSGNRAELVASKTPGPGSYESMSTLGGNPVMKSPGKYSLRFRHAPPPADVTPGPPAAGTCFK